MRNAGLFGLPRHSYVEATAQSKLAPACLQILSKRVNFRQYLVFLHKRILIVKLLQRTNVKCKLNFCYSQWPQR